jgi:Flp pilus assembly protein TadG
MLLRRVPSRARGRRGATLVEFAVVVPIFFTIVFGLCDIGRGFMVKSLLANAARAGCRTGTLPNKANSDITSSVTAALTGQGIRGSQTTVAVNGDSSADASAAQSGDQITVTVSVSVSNISWLPGTDYITGSLSSSFALLRE